MSAADHGPEPPMAAFVVGAALRVLLWLTLLVLPLTSYVLTRQWWVCALVSIAGVWLWQRVAPMQVRSTLSGHSHFVLLLAAAGGTFLAIIDTLRPFA